MSLSLLLQVASVITLSRGEATSMVKNPSTTEATRVTIELRHATQVGSTVTLGTEVRGIIAPAAFTLAPGETQIVRFRVREANTPGTVLRLVTTFTPTAVDTPARGSETTAVARLLTVIRLVTKVIVE